jgi:outer membrane protein OmpA-like peptidoglycan-associated protein
MSDDKDETQKYGLILLTAVVGAVVAGVVGYAVTHRTGGGTQTNGHNSGHNSGHTTTAAKTVAIVATVPEIYTTPQPPAAELTAVPAHESHDAASTAAATQPLGSIYFEVSSDALPANAAQAISQVAKAAQTQVGKSIVISGFHDASGNPAQNAELAKRRALAVRKGLEAQGIAPQLLVMEKPALTTGGGDAREARRVELRLR